MKTSHKPICVALLGEFSAGKSTLANLLLGRVQSPVRVTATQMPPLWYTYGNGAPIRVLSDDREEELDDTDEIKVPLEETKAVRLPLDAPILDRFDLLDMPGSADPNMSPDVWDGLLPQADIVIWCTPATQAWRQSEAAIWDTMPVRLQNRSMLLLTRFDKVGDTDRARVLNRVRRETEGLFRHVLPTALHGLTQAPEDCYASGMADMMEALDDLLVNPKPRPIVEETPDLDAANEARAPIAPRRVSTLSGAGGGTQRRRPSALI